MLVEISTLARRPLASVRRFAPGSGMKAGLPSDSARERVEVNHNIYHTPRTIQIQKITIRQGRYFKTESRRP